MLNVVARRNTIHTQPVGCAWCVTMIHHEMTRLHDRLKKYQTREVAIWALSIGASICSLILAGTVYHYHRRRRSSIAPDDEDRTTGRSNVSGKGVDDRKLFLTIRSARSQLVSAQVWRQFEEAAYLIRNDGESKQNVAIKHLTNGDKLLLYALYKQIVDGNAPPKMIHSRTNWNIMAEKAKYDAWIRMRDIPIDAAIDHYVTAVAHFCSAVPLQPKSNCGDKDDDFDEDDTITSYSESSDVVMEAVFAPATVSRPGIENGGIDYDENDRTDVRNGGAENGNNISLEVQLLHAVGRNSLESVQNILNQAMVVNVNYSDETGQTALHLAADKGNTEVVQLLLKSGGNVNAADHDGISVLQAAVIAGHVATCQLLLAQKADPDQPDHDGDTPRSCCEDDLENIEMIQLFAKY